MQAGDTLGAYRVLARVGQGGMGEVYRARDTKLDRDVALKILPDVFASDPDRLMRFQREAKSLASLNHPHIAQIYGIEESASGRALVMELVEGETLADRIARGPIPVDDVLRIGRQIAEALEAAHDSGIVHRDLKPANVKVRPDGTVKVLDFGLAKSLVASHGDGAVHDVNPAQSPTFTSPAVTQMGVILGTAAYMAPEQARGAPADARSDIWALGVVLYEMLTGKPLFDGDHVSDVLAAVLRDGPKWEALPAETPPSLRRLLERCLRKDPQTRLRHAGDARIELADAAVEPPVAAGRAPAARHSRVSLMAAAAVAVTAVVAYLASRTTTPTDVPVRKWVIPQDYAEEYFGRENTPAISPDGRTIAYVDGDRLRLRDLATLESRTVPGTGVAGMPVWSPDGSAVAFYLDHKTLWRVAARGESAVKISDLPAGIVMGLAWRADRTIVVNVAYGPTAGELFRVAEGGGRPERYMPVAGDTAAIFYMRGMPDGSLVYGRRDGTTVTPVLARSDGTLKPLNLPRYTALSYAPTGHLLYAGGETPGVWAVGFDLAAGEVRGEPFRVAEHGTAPSVSNDGTLVYGRSQPGARQLVWMDREGIVRGSIGQSQDDLVWPALSPDGSRVAVSASENGVRSIWIHEIARPVKSRVSAGNGDFDAAWHPDGDRIAYGTAAWDIMTVAAEGGTPTPLVSGPMPEFHPQWSRSGQLLFGRFGPKTQADVWFFESGAREAKPFLEGPHNEADTMLSPDGKYAAYVSDETGTNEVFVRAFPGGRGRRQVSFRGGRYPAWHPKGTELYFMEGETLMATPITMGATLEAGTPRPLFNLERRAAEFRIYEPVDGQRFIVARTLTPPQNGVAVVQNWLGEFQGR